MRCNRWCFGGAVFSLLLLACSAEDNGRAKCGDPDTHSSLDAGGNCLCDDNYEWRYPNDPFDAVCVTTLSECFCDTTSACDAQCPCDPACSTCAADGGCVALCATPDPTAPSVPATRQRPAKPAVSVTPIALPAPAVTGVSTRADARSRLPAEESLTTTDGTFYYGYTGGAFTCDEACVDAGHLGCSTQCENGAGQAIYQRTSSSSTFTRDVDVSSCSQAIAPSLTRSRARMRCTTTPAVAEHSSRYWRRYCRTRAG